MHYKTKYNKMLLQNLCNKNVISNNFDLFCATTHTYNTKKPTFSQKLVLTSTLTKNNSKSTRKKNKQPLTQSFIFYKYNSLDV